MWWLQWTKDGVAKLDDPVVSSGVINALACSFRGSERRVGSGVFP